MKYGVYKDTNNTTYDIYNLYVAMYSDSYPDNTVYLKRYSKLIISNPNNNADNVISIPQFCVD